MNVMHQSYIAHVMSYAACIGPHAGEPCTNNRSFLIRDREDSSAAVGLVSIEYDYFLVHKIVLSTFCFQSNASVPFLLAVALFATRNLRLM